MSLEKLHTDASGVPGPGTEPGKDWLNSGEVVNRIIRDFAAELLKKVSEPDFLSWLEFECRRMNGIFMGSAPSDRYSRGPWNRPDQLGEFVLQAMQINGETHTAVRDAFMVFSNHLLSIAVSAGEDFDAAQSSEIDELIARLRDALLGLTGSVSQ